MGSEKKKTWREMTLAERKAKTRWIRNLLLAIFFITVVLLILSIFG